MNASNGQVADEGVAYGMEVGEAALGVLEGDSGRFQLLAQHQRTSSPPHRESRTR